MEFLEEAAIFLGTAIIAVPLFRRLGFGSVLGYLAAGVVIGPWALGLISDSENILHFAELGVGEVRARSGATQASIEYSFVLLTMSCNFLLAVVEPWALPVLISIPQPPTQVTSPDNVRSMAGSTPLVSNALLPWPALNS